MFAILVLLMASQTHTAHATVAIAEREWLSFDDAAEPPLRIETRIPAQARLVAGPAGRQAVSVTVPDMERDEKACAFTIDLPPIPAQFNALRVWARGTKETKRLEIVLRTKAGSFVIDVPVEPEWRPIIVAPHNTRPYFGQATGPLEISDTTRLRFCFGMWQGHQGGPHTVSVGPISAIQSPLFSQAPEPQIAPRPDVPLPMQPFIVELLDLCRGRWEFVTPLGGRLSLFGPVQACSFLDANGRPVRLAYLCCDPEFPEDLDHAELRTVPPVAQADGKLWFRIHEPQFGCGVMAEPVGRRMFRCELHDINLGPERTGQKYIAGLYLVADGEASPIWLASASATPGPHLRVLTDRVGNVFTEDEPVEVSLVALDEPAEATKTASLQVIDYSTREVVWRATAQVPCAPDAVQPCQVTIPLERFGVFEVRARAGEQSVAARVCRVPSPREIHPDRSAIGVNIFQQQVWWYAYQTPLMATAGVHWMRPWLSWENTWHVQEGVQGEWDTRALDAALRRMEAHGQRYEYIIFSAPEWIAGPGSRVPPVEKMDQWAAYVGRLVSRYKGRITHWEVWNEPDLMWPEETRGAGQHYFAMLKATWEAAKAADPNCIIDGLSHAGHESWLHNLGKLDPGRYMDVATIHTYAAPREFAAQVARRRELLDRYGMKDKPIWVNELGTTAFDFSPDYSRKYGCSELTQARVLMANYAQALTCGPDTKAFWFCTYDPRDPAHRSQWTYDAGIGLLYIGFLPKLSYAALAGVSHELDGRRCFGHTVRNQDLHQVSFEGPVTVVWSARPQATGELPATDLGCLPDERITVRDMFTNELASGTADDVLVDLAHGPVYLEGSPQMTAITRAENAVRVTPQAVTLSPTAPASLRLTAPEGADIVCQLRPGLPLRTSLERTRQGAIVTLTPADEPVRAAGLLQLRVRMGEGILGLREPIQCLRAATVTVGAPNMVRDGGFLAGNTFEWFGERTSSFRWDPDQGHREPGSLRLDAPFDRRLVYRGITLDTARPARFQCWVKTDALSHCRATVNLALLEPDKWIKTWSLARSAAPGEEPEWGHHFIDSPGAISSGTTAWTLVEATLEADQIPHETTRAALFIDVAGDGSGALWFDDIDLWQ